MTSVKIDPRQWNIIHAMKNCMIKDDGKDDNRPFIDELNKKLYSICFLQFLPDYKEPVNLLLKRHALVIKENTVKSFEKAKLQRKIVYKNLEYYAKKNRYNPSSFDSELWEIQCNSSHQIGGGGFEQTKDYIRRLSMMGLGTILIVPNKYKDKNFIILEETANLDTGDDVALICYESENEKQGKLDYDVIQLNTILLTFFNRACRTVIILLLNMHLYIKMYVPKIIHFP